MPTTIMDVGHHFDDIPWTIRRGQVTDITGKENTPRKMLLMSCIELSFAAS